jgi:hypothetical protein
LKYCLRNRWRSPRGGCSVSHKHWKLVSHQSKASSDYGRDVVSYQVLEPHRDLLRYTNITNFWWQLGILLLALYHPISYRSIPCLHACGNILFANLSKCSGIEDRNLRSICWPFSIWHIECMPTSRDSAWIYRHMDRVP